MKRVLPIMLMFSVLTGLKAQNSPSALVMTRLIADKIIRETSFDYDLKGLGYNAGWSQFRITGINENEQYFAYVSLDSEKEGSSRIGLSYQGNITVFLNGNIIFSGKSDSLLLSEYTYNRFHMQEVIPANFRKGKNEIVISCGQYAGSTNVMLMAVNELDAPEPYISMIPRISDPGASVWLISGPYSNETVADDITGLIIGPGDSPENTGIFPAWEIPAMPVIRELRISESNSYTRDSYADWHYANGGTMLGILSLYRVSGEIKYLDFVSKYASNILENREYFQWQYKQLHAMRGSFHRMFRMTMLDDSGGPALPFAELKLLQPGLDYDFLLDEVLNYVVYREHRLTDRTLCRPEPESNTIWADDLFMAAPFLCRMAEISGNKSLYDDVARQVIQFNKYLQDEESGLYYHGWYADRNEPASILWGRANGWVCWAMSEVLILLPEDHSDYKKILRIFRDHIQAVAEYQDANGMWHQVLDHPETYEETSCTAMFTLALARGVRYGWLKKNYGEIAIRGWNALSEKIGEDGTVIGICRGTGIGETLEYYNERRTFDHDPRGLGAMLTAGTEIHLLLQSSSDTGSD